MPHVMTDSGDGLASSFHAAFDELILGLVFGAAFSAVVTDEPD
jgi:hypothetical protein